MPLSKEEQNIIQQAEGYNVGDLALGLKDRRGNIWKRKDITNRHSLKTNIYALDLVNKNRPTDNFQFAWVPFKDSDFYQDLKDDGYKVVTKGEWVLNREAWEWFTPEKDLFRWAVDNMLVNRNEFLMYRNETLWKEEQERRLNFNEQRINARQESTAEAALKHAYDSGIGIEVDASGPNGTVTAGGVRRTHTVS